EGVPVSPNLQWRPTRRDPRLKSREPPPRPRSPGPWGILFAPASPCGSASRGKGPGPGRRRPPDEWEFPPGGLPPPKSTPNNRWGGDRGPRHFSPGYDEGSPDHAPQSESRRFFSRSIRPIGPRNLPAEGLIQQEKLPEAALRGKKA